MPELGHETGFRSAVEVLAARNCCDISFRSADLDLVRRPDNQARGRTMAGLATVETAAAGPDSGGRALGALQGRPGAAGSRCGDPCRIRRPSQRARPDT